MFGNPGTVEQGFLDALSSYTDFTYVLALQETVAVGIADGYARATRKPAIVQLHSGVSSGNGIGLLYQAKRGHTPYMDWQDLDFDIPPVPGRRWYRVVDTSLPSPNDIAENLADPGENAAISGPVYHATGRSVVVFISRE